MHRALLRCVPSGVVGAIDQALLKVTALATATWHVTKPSPMTVEAR